MCGTRLCGFSIGLLVVAFTVAYFTEDDLLTVHVWVGYVVGGLVVARVVWGFIGPARARLLMWRHVSGRPQDPA